MTEEKEKAHTAMMHEAIKEAEKGLGLCTPNPAVGAIILNEAGEIIARGSHSKAGQDHAEKAAIKALPEREQPYTIIVTLEPCSTEGKTGACVRSIIEAGIQEVIYGSIDPNPAHCGAAKGQLEQAGIRVTEGFLKEQCDHLIRGFTKRIQGGRPWIISKRALSLDGSSSRPPTEEQWLSGEESLADVQQLRKEVDAIIIGGETARRDNPALTYRGKEERKEQPERIVISAKAEENAGLTKDAKLLSDGYRDKTCFVKSIEDALTHIQNREYNMVLIESGGALERAFRERGLIDETITYVTPRLCGSMKSLRGSMEKMKKEKAKVIAEKRAPKEIDRWGNDLKITK